MSVKEKSRLRIVAGEDHGDERKRTTDEVSKQMKVVSKLGFFLGSRISTGWNLLTARAAPGIKVA